jgi:hypothetical protein
MTGKPPVGWSGCATALKALTARVADLEKHSHRPIDLTSAMDELLDARGYVATAPAPADHNGIAWRPMWMAKGVRDGRHILLRFQGEKPIKDALVIFGAVIGSWNGNEREWVLSVDPWDLTGGRGAGLLDDDFTAWAPLPDLTTQQIEELAGA